MGYVCVRLCVLLLRRCVGVSGSKKMQSIGFDLSKESFGIASLAEYCKEGYHRFLEISWESAYSIKAYDL